MPKHNLNIAQIREPERQKSVTNDKPVGTRGYRTSIRLRPSTIHAASSYWFLCNRLYNRGEIAAAAESWRAALRLAPTLSAATHNLLMAQAKLESQHSDNINMVGGQSASEMTKKKATRQGKTKNGNQSNKRRKKRKKRKRKRKKRTSARQEQKLAAKAKTCDKKNRKRRRRRKKKRKMMN